MSVTIKRKDLTMAQTPAFAVFIFVGGEYELLVHEFCAILHNICLLQGCRLGPGYGAKCGANLAICFGPHVLNLVMVESHA